MENREIVRSYVQKADLALADLTNSGGVLQPQQAREFYRIMIEPSVLLNDIATPPLSGPTQIVDQLGLLNRILRRGQDGQQLSVADRYKPDLAKVQFTARELKTQVNLTYSLLDDSIEGSGLSDTIRSMMADAVRRDLEDLVVNGDTSSTDPLLVNFNGLLKQQSSHVVDRNGGNIQTIQLGHFTDMYKAFPKEAMLPDRQNMRFYGGWQAEAKYREVLASRATVGGDAWINMNPGTLSPYGIPFKPVPRFPENLGAGTNETNLVLVDPKNLALGLWKDLMWKALDDIQGGNVIVVGRMRCDFKIIYEPFSVKAIHIGY